MAKKNNKKIKIGKKCTLGENVIFLGNVTIGNNCKIGNNVILGFCSIGNDTVIEDDVTLSINSVILGHVQVMKGSNCGSGCQVHQYQVIGSWSMLGMGCVVPKKLKIEPGQTWAGNPARRLKTNMYALDKWDIDEFELFEETARYKQLVEARGL